MCFFNAKDANAARDANVCDRRLTVATFASFAPFALSMVLCAFGELSFRPGMGDAFDKIALRDNENNQNRQDGQNQKRHDIMDIHLLGALSENDV